MHTMGGGQSDMMNLTVKLDAKQVIQMLGQLPEQSRKAMVSAMKSEGNYMRGVLVQTAKATKTGGAPITMALRKGRRSVWQVLAPLMRYHVDPAKMELYVGLIKHGPRPIERRVEVLAKKHSRGYAQMVTRASQRSLARKLQSKYRAISESGAWEHVGGLSSYIPKIGHHQVRKSPTIQDVYVRQQIAMIQRIKKNYSIKAAGGRY